jgi:hypothetical protein
MGIEKDNRNLRIRKSPKMRERMKIIFITMLSIPVEPFRN